MQQILLLIEGARQAQSLELDRHEILQYALAFFENRGQLLARKAAAARERYRHRLCEDNRLWASKHYTPQEREKLSGSAQSGMASQLEVIGVFEGQPNSSDRVQQWQQFETKFRFCMHRACVPEALSEEKRRQWFLSAAPGRSIRHAGMALARLRNISEPIHSEIEEKVRQMTNGTKWKFEILRDPELRATVDRASLSDDAKARLRAIENVGPLKPAQGSENLNGSQVFETLNRKSPAWTVGWKAPGRDRRIHLLVPKQIKDALKEMPHVYFTPRGTRLEAPMGNVLRRRVDGGEERLSLCHIKGTSNSDMLISLWEHQVGSRFVLKGRPLLTNNNGKGVSFAPPLEPTDCLYLLMCFLDYLYPDSATFDSSRLDVFEDECVWRHLKGSLAIHDTGHPWAEYLLDMDSSAGASKALAHSIPLIRKWKAVNTMVAVPGFASKQARNIYTIGCPKSGSLFVN